MNLKNYNHTKKTLSTESAYNLLKELSSAGSHICVSGNIQGDSMFPWIKNGDKVSIIPITAPIRNGDIIAFYQGSPSRFVAHRVIKSMPGQTITKGDNCFAADLPIKNTDIAGKIVKIERKSNQKFFGMGKEKIVITILSQLNILQIGIRIWKNLKRLFS